MLKFTKQTIKEQSLNISLKPVFFMLLEDQVNQIKILIKKYFEANQTLLLTSAKYKIPLSVPSFSWEEVTEVVDSLLSTHLTMGEKVKRFENLFAKYIGSKEAIMVNSGSSANLIALSILSNPILGNNAIKPGDEVIVPAVAWSTSIFPILFRANIHISNGSSLRCNFIEK